MTTSNQTPSPDEVRDALRRMNQGAVPVDHDALQKIFRRTVQQVGRGVRLEKPAGPAQVPARRRLPTALVVLSAAAALLLVAILIPTGQAGERPSLSRLIQHLQSARTVTVEGEQHGEAIRLTLNAPGTVRWDDGTNRYRLADGNQLWEVNSATGEVLAAEDSPLPAEGVDALQLLGLEALTDQPLSRMKPVRREDFSGREHLCYETSMVFRNQPAVLVTYVRPGERQVSGFRIFSNDPKDHRRERRQLAEFRLRLNREQDVIQPADLHRSLQNDGRVGLLGEVRGLVFVRTFPGHRWTPARPSTPLFAGDQIRCEARGANASLIRLSNGSTLVPGPGAQLRLHPDGSVQLQAGDLKTSGEVSLSGPSGRSQSSTGDAVFRIARRADRNAAPDSALVLQKLDFEPAWLKTLSDRLTTETMGSLVAQVEDRAVSLTLGFHHVSVNIRNQIARTVIEESFVNHTDERLEGVFQFPLPHDASISGFGMWIGDQLVEADVVEKQRAREIYETILREKRDPGLLEWAGGNVFKARVFPIEPHSEKKIRITYTQTLPLQNGSFRYSYALRSEMLQKNPLRDLSVDVTLHSEVPLQQVHSPSHKTADVQLTEYSARVRYTARDVTPQRDFELVCTLDDRQPDVVAIPHVRGDDGYLMVQLSPPSVADGNWSRALVRDGTPLDVILVCDTSRSMDEVARRQQSDLAAALMGSLGQSDRLRMVCCDVDCAWLQAEAVPVTEPLRERLLQQLQDRPSLGWSNLRGCLEEILNRGERNTQVIYLGDGTVVNEFSDARADFLAWMQQVAQNAARFETGPVTASEVRPNLGKGIPTVHGVAVGNMFDMAVLNAMSLVNGGTRRAVAGSESAVEVARQLLFEITRPGLKDIRVQFKGVQVAAIHPQPLPNLADGMQQILTARFLPAPDLANAEIIVTGRRGNEDVRYTARLRLEDRHTAAVSNSQAAAAADGTPGDRATEAVDQNSFIPRLWAKAQIDSLLKEAATAEIREQIVRLSQHYHLITPFTSLLVLESDADRKRFGVERHLQMRDGEQFFADGRKEAEYSLRQQQLAQARLYRQQLYQQYRRQIQSLGQDAIVVPTGFAGSTHNRRRDFDGETALQRRTHFGRSLYSRLQGLSEGRGGRDKSDFDVYFGDLLLFGRQPEARVSRYDGFNSDQRWGVIWSGPTNGQSGVRGEYEFLGRSVQNETGADRYEWAENFSFSAKGMMGEPLIEQKILGHRYIQPQGLSRGGSAGAQDGRHNEFRTELPYQLWDLEEGQQRRRPTDAGIYAGKGFGVASGFELPAVRVEPPTFGMSNALPEREPAAKSEVSWPDRVADLFPDVQHATEAGAEPRPKSEAPLHGQIDWPKSVIAALDSLTDSLQDIGPGLDVRSENQQLHAVSGSLINTTRHRMVWIGSAGWLQVTPTAFGPQIAYSIDGRSGVWLPAFDTGRIGDQDVPQKAKCPIQIPAAEVRRLATTHWTNWAAVVENDDPQRFTIVLTHRQEPWRQQRIVIDRQRRCVLSRETLVDGMIVQAERYSDFLQIQNVWLPQQSMKLEFQPVADVLRPVQKTFWKWNDVTIELFREAVEPLLPDAGTVLLLPERLPSQRETESRTDSDSPELRFDLVRLFQLMRDGRWQEAAQTRDQLNARWPQFADNLWVNWLIRLQLPARESLRQDFAAVVQQNAMSWPGFADADKDEQRAIVSRMRWLSRQLQSTADQLNTLERLLAALEPVEESRVIDLKLQRIELLQQTGRPKAATEALKILLAAHPYRYDLQHRRLRDLQSNGDVQAVRESYLHLVSADQRWNTSEWNDAYQRFLEWLRSRADYDTALQICKQWTKRCPFESESWQHLMRCELELDHPDRVRELRDQWLQIVLAQEDRERGEQSDTPPSDRFDLSERLPATKEARFLAAFHFGFGKLAGLSLAGPQTEIRQEMIHAADLLSRHGRYLHLADRILNNKEFARQPAARTLVKQILLRLAEQLKQHEGTGLSVSRRRLEAVFSWLQASGVSGSDEHNEVLDAMRGRLDRGTGSLHYEDLELLLFRWGVAFDEDTPKEQRHAWTDQLVSRWQQADSLAEQWMWSLLLAKFETKAFDRPHQLKWFRRQLQKSRKEFRPVAAGQLFDQLLKEPWSQDLEDESWQLIDRTQPVPEMFRTPDDWTAGDVQQLPFWWSQVQRWTSAMLAAKAKSLQQQDDKWEDRSAAQRRVLQQQFQVAALRHLLQSVHNQVDQLSAEDAEQPQLVRRSSWLRMLKIQLQKRLLTADTIAGVSDADKRKLQSDILKAVRELLPSNPVPTPEAVVAANPAEETMSDAVRLQARHWLLSNWIHLGLAADAEYSTNHAAEILTYLRQGAKIDGVAPRAWRAAEFAVLIAVDRPQELEQRLRHWLQHDDHTAPWRRHLGHLLAELDRLDEAITLYEEAGRKDRLTATDWKQLSVWQHALNRRSDSETSLWQEWRHLSTGQKHARLKNRLNGWKAGVSSRSPMAPAEVKRQLHELMQTTTDLSGSYQLLRSWHRATHDPRLLKALAPFVTGRSRAEMLTALSLTQSLINSLNQEAALDAIADGIRQAEQNGLSDREENEQRSVDELALNLLRLQARCHASRILNQPGMHAAAARTALSALADGEFAPEERPLVVERLSHLGRLPDSALSQQRLRMALRLVRSLPVSEPGRLSAALHVAAIYRRDRQPGRAAGLLEAELRQHIVSTDVWSGVAGTALDQMVAWHLEHDRFLAAEQWMMNVLDRFDENSLKTRLWNTRLTTLRSNGQSVVGQGAELYQFLVESVWSDVMDPKQNDSFPPAFERLLQVLDAGLDAKRPEVAEEIQRLSDRADHLIRRFSSQHISTIQRLLQLHRRTHGPRAAVEFLLQRLNAQPVALQWTEPRSVWKHFADNLYEITWPEDVDYETNKRRRQIVAELKPLRRQIERVLLDGFAKGLAARDRSQHQYFDHRRAAMYRNGTERVLRIVDQVAQQHADSLAEIEFLVRFLKDHYEDQQPRSIVLLKSALRSDIGTDATRMKLVALYEQTDQHEEAATLLREMIKRQPKTKDLRFRLIRTLHRLKDADAVRQQLDYVQEHLVDVIDGSVSAVFELADLCADVALWDEACRLFQAAFDRTDWPARPDRRLALRWNRFAECLMHQQQYRKAVDAVAAAWVVVDQHPDSRQQIRSRLNEVLSMAENLKPIAQHVRRRAERNGEDSSFLRLALGRAFLEHKQPAAAEKHLRVALELNPVSTQASTLLVESLDQQQKPAAAIDAVLQQGRFAEDRTACLTDLYRRYREQQDLTNAERAATSIVEIAVEESANHAALAELREGQKQWSSAIRHWQRAAELKAEEPWALLRLAQLQLKTGQRQEARQTYLRLRRREWDDRFETLPERLRKLRSQINTR